MADPVEYDYLHDPQAIYDKSFAIAREEADLSNLPDNLHEIALRIIHACGNSDLPADLAWGGDPAAAGRAALRAGAPILVDSMMVRHGIIDRHLPAQNPILCTLNDHGVAELASERGDTRSAIAVRPRPSTGGPWCGAT